MKHSPADLQAMAVEALRARRDNDPRWKVLVARLMARTGMSAANVEANIMLMAAGVMV
jgi:hypothetical protein